MAVQIFANNAFSTLDGSILVGATTINVQAADAAKFPSPTAGDWFLATLTDGAGNVEIVRCTARAVAALTVVRAQEGTVAFAFASGSRIDMRLTAGSLGNYVLGPASVVDNAVPRFDLTTGKIVQTSGLIIDDSNNVTGLVGLTPTGLIDISGAGASQIKFGNANNSANVDTLDGYKDFVTSSPTLIGFGTPTNVSYFSKRVGDALYIFAGWTPGTVTAVEARIPLLLGGVALTSDATKIPAIITCGAAVIDTFSATFFGIAPLIESGVTYMTLGAQRSNSSAFTKALATIIGTGVKVGLVAIVPISTW